MTRTPAKELQSDGCVEVLVAPAADSGLILSKCAASEQLTH